MLLRCLVKPGLSLLILLVTAGVIAPAVAVDAPDFRLTVVTHEPGHFSWEAAARLVDTAAENGLEILPQLAARPGEKKPGTVSPDLLLMPLRSLATQGWELLALWDEGMHALSGQRRYDRAINLTGMEFILLRPDPVAEKQFRAFDAWTRFAQPQTREQLLRECMIGSRSASLQQIWHERLDRVHLAVSLTAHRYEGWVVIAPAGPWNTRSDKDRAMLLKALSSTTQWQRADSKQRETDALKQLKTSGMQVHYLDAEQRKAFLELLPAWEALLSDELEHSLRQKLVAAATTGIVERPTGQEALPKTQPATPGG
jgi:hypothetical protein